ncbi:hypothetical protein SNF32_13015 [Enterococcus mundtii]|nr:hypothetical protein [Enterococcus mundtii]
MVKSIGPLEGMTLGAKLGTFVPFIGNGVGAAIGFTAGLVNKGIQLLAPDVYDRGKTWAYEVYDRSTEK